MIDRDNIASETSLVLERLDAIERRQRLANSRIRQDLAAITAAVGMLFILSISMWSGYAWSWWYAVATALIVPTTMGWLVNKVQDQEEP
jgi:hypothetical protein